MSPVINGSVDEIVNWKESSRLFFVSTANVLSGVSVPDDVRAPWEVFRQMLGLTIQAGIVRIVASVM